MYFVHGNPLSDSGSDCQCSGKVKLKPWHLTQLGKSHPHRDQRQRKSCLFTIYLLAVLVSLHNKCFLWLKLQRVTIQTKQVWRDCGKSISKHKNMLPYHVAKCFSKHFDPPVTCGWYLKSRKVIPTKSLNPKQILMHLTLPHQHIARSRSRIRKGGTFPDFLETYFQVWYLPIW